jgi:DNA-binding NarL/FixJ family response regulator
MQAASQEAMLDMVQNPITCWGKNRWEKEPASAEEMADITRVHSLIHAHLINRVQAPRRVPKVWDPMDERKKITTPKEQVKVVVMRYPLDGSKGMKIKAIAEKLGLKARTVKLILSRWRHNG